MIVRLEAFAFHFYVWSLSLLQVESHISFEGDLNHFGFLWAWQSLRLAPP